MKRIRHFLFVLIFLSPFLSVAQDTLFFFNGNKVVAKIEEINPTTIKYKRLNFLDGPYYVVDKSEIAKIVYHTREEEIITAKKITKLADMSYLDLVKHQLNAETSLLSVNIIALTLARLNISYEKLLLHNHIGLWVPVTYQMDKSIALNSGYNDWVNYRIGLALKYYTKPNELFSFYAGPLVEYGNFNYLSGGGGRKGSRTLPRQINTNYSSFSGLIGWSFQPTGYLNISLYGAFGGKFFNHSAQRANPVSLINYEAGVTLGYRFKL